MARRSATIKARARSVSACFRSPSIYGSAACAQRVIGPTDCAFQFEAICYAVPHCDNRFRMLVALGSSRSHHEGDVGGSPYEQVWRANCCCWNGVFPIRRSNYSEGDLSCHMRTSERVLMPVTRARSPAIIVQLPACENGTSMKCGSV